MTVRRPIGSARASNVKPSGDVSVKGIDSFIIYRGIVSTGRNGVGENYDHDVLILCPSLTWSLAVSGLVEFLFALFMPGKAVLMRWIPALYSDDYTILICGVPLYICT